MNFTRHIFVLISLCLGVVKISAEFAPETQNDLMYLETDPPSQLAKQEFGDNESSTTRSFWPDLSAMARSIWPLFLFPSGKSSDEKTSVTPTPEPDPPLIMWRIRFFLFGTNGTTHAPSTTEAAATDAVLKTEPTTPSYVTPTKDLKSNRKKRHHVYKRYPLPSYIDLDKRYTEAQDGFKKSKNAVKWMSMNDIHHTFNRNSSNKDCNRKRLYAYVWTVDWQSLLAHVVVVLVFMLSIIVTLVYCQHLYNTIVALKRVKAKKSSKFDAIYTV